MDITLYPKRYQKSIEMLMDRLCTSADKAYSMMLMTAALMDLEPEDEKVAEMILLDCDLEVRA